MTQVVYVDILVVVNVYVNYGLLRLCSLICRQKSKPWRFVASAVLGGFSSVMILIPSIPNGIFIILRLILALILVYAAFGFSNKLQFLRAFGSFFFVNFIFAGLMLALWLFVSPKSMLYSTGIVYFNIDTMSLVILTLICYAVMRLIHMLIEFKTPRNTIYDMEILVSETKFLCRAFLDTGNSLKEPFSSLPVIIVNQNISDYANTKKLIAAFADGGYPERIVTASTVNSVNVLHAYKPDKIHIKGIKTEFETSLVYIALTQTKIKNGDFDALLNPSIFENQTNEAGEYYAEKIEN